MPEPIDAPLLPPMSPEAARVYKLLKPGLRYTYQEIAVALDINEQTARMRLARMAERGHIVRLGANRYYRYALPQASDESAHRRREECIGRNLPASW